MERQGTKLGDASWHDDVERLVRRLEGRPPPAKLHACLVGELQIGWTLAHVETANPVCGEGQGVADGLRAEGGAGFDLARVDPYAVLVQLDPVDPRGQPQHRREALGLDRRDDVRDRRVDVGVRAAALIQEGAEVRRKPGRPGVEASHGAFITVLSANSSAASHLTR